MKKNTKTCNLCSNRDTCIQLCEDKKKNNKKIKKIIMIFILILHSMHLK
ncbi:hypothetical protein [Brachyspira hyodysenteriae]|nr:hypothetical protein [Brachyspira hyodysenteriae]MCZ9991894.1 hypothetical protein [Brachyspira hyodysenteriae]